MAVINSRADGIILSVHNSCSGTRRGLVRDIDFHMDPDSDWLPVKDAIGKAAKNLPDSSDGEKVAWALEQVFMEMKWRVGGRQVYRFSEQHIAKLEQIDNFIVHTAELAPLDRMGVFLVGPPPLDYGTMVYLEALPVGTFVTAVRFIDLTDNGSGVSHTKVALLKDGEPLADGLAHSISAIYPVASDDGYYAMTMRDELTIAVKMVLCAASSAVEMKRIKIPKDKRLRDKAGKGINLQVFDILDIPDGLLPNLGTED